MDYHAKACGISPRNASNVSIEEMRMAQKRAAEMQHIAAVSSKIERAPQTPPIMEQFYDRISRAVDRTQEASSDISFLLDRLQGGQGGEIGADVEPAKGPGVLGAIEYQIWLLHEKLDVLNARVKMLNRLG